MKQTVRSKDGGELTYGSFGEVERAWSMGFVEPDDEILEEGQTKWRRAGSIPVLVNARRQGDQVWGGSQAALVVIGVLVASFALYLIGKGQYLYGGLLTVVVILVTGRMMTQAAKRTRPHGKLK